MYTHEETLELLQRAVAEKGDGHVVTDCVYANEDMMPMCIVGHVLSYVGLLDEATGWSTCLAATLPALQENFTPAAIGALDVAQAVQDGCGIHRGIGRTWGEALIAAKEVAPWGGPLIASKGVAP